MGRGPRHARTLGEVLTPFDDYPVHQTSQPIAITASADPNHYDRVCFNGYLRDASLYFGVALGLYPNRHVIDGAFSVVRAGQQVSVFASGRCPTDRTHPEVGPRRVEIVEPMRVLRVVVDAPDQGLAADLVFRASTPPVEEPPFVLRQGVRTVFDYTRLTQFGAWDGWVAVDGERVPVAPSDVLGSRDRSWGVRPVGERPAGPPPITQFFWLWAPVHLGSRCVHLDVQEQADGRRWHEAAFHVPLGGGEPEALRGLDYRLTWEPGTRRVATFEADLLPWQGDPVTLVLAPLLHFQLAGLGYTHPQWRHGLWMGELAVGGDRWRLPVTDPVAPHHIHVQTLCRARLGDEEGIGLLEQLAVGPHEPTGLTGLFDPA